MRLRFAAWLAGLVLLALLLAFQVIPKLRLETDILALLPRAERDAAVEEAMRSLGDSAGRRALLLAGAPEFVDARAGAAALAARLRAEPSFASVELEVGAQKLQALTAAYSPYHDALLAPRQRTLLEEGEAERLLADARRALYTPATVPRPLPLAQDPLNLLGEFVAAQRPASRLTLREGVLTMHDGALHQVLVSATLADSPFSTRVQEAAGAALEQARAAAQAAGATQVLASGVVMHAAAAGRQAKREIGLFGNLSLAGVALLMWLAFGSLRLLLLTGLIVASGAAAGLAACHYAFGGMHILTLVFGCTLAGVATDYAIHFYSDQLHAPGQWQPAAALARVGPGLSLGMATVALCYLALLFAPFPGLRQMALFTVTGLVTAWAGVLCAFPLLARATPARRAARTLAAAGRWAAVVRHLQAPAGRLALWLGVGFAAAGLARAQFLDDIRLLQASPPELVAQEQALRERVGANTDTRLFLVRGADAESALQRTEQLATLLDAAVAAGTLHSYQALSQRLPSLQRQASDRALLAPLYAPGGVAERLLQELGLGGASSAARQAAFAAAAQHPLTLEAWLASPAAEGAAQLWLGSIDGGAATVVTLAGVRDPAALPALAAQVPGVEWVDTVANTSDVMARYRRVAALLIAAAGALGVGLLALRFGIAGALRVVAVPVGAGLATLGGLAWAGIAVNLFSVIAMLLVIGLAVDYPVLLREARAQPVPAAFAVALSALTTLLSFGMLAFSQTPFIHAIGLTIAVGVILALLLALSLNPAPLQGSLHDP